MGCIVSQYQGPGPRLRWWGLFFAIMGLVLGIPALSAGLDLNSQAIEEIGAMGNLDPITFLVVGDTRGPGSRFYLLAPQMRDDRGELVIHLGDLTNRGGPSEYREALSMLKSIRKPFLVVAGNHELVDRGGPRFEALFGPRGDRWFRVGKVLFLLIDNADGGPLPGERLLEIDRVLREDAPVKLVFMHMPLFDPRGAGFRHAMDPRGAAELLEIFKRRGVSHVFASHVHGFFEGRWDGVPYTISGGGGARLYTKDPAHGFYHYHRVTAGSSGVSVETVPLGGYVR